MLRLGLRFGDCICVDRGNSRLSTFAKIDSKFDFYYYYTNTRVKRNIRVLHHVLPFLRMVDNLRVRGHPYNLPEWIVPMFTRNHLLCVLRMVSYNLIYPLLVWHSVSTPICFYSSLVLVFYVLYCFSLRCHVTFLFVCVCHTE